MRELDGPRFFRLAWRISAYGGVMTNRLRALHLEALRQQAPQPHLQPHLPVQYARPEQPPPRVKVSEGATVVPLAAFMARTGGGGGEYARVAKSKTEVG